MPYVVRWLALFWASCFVLAFTGSIVFAHGIEIEVRREGPVLRGEVREPRGSAIADMPVSVSRPAESTPLIQGRSDTSGRFHFTVDPDEVYRVVVDDGLGHRAEATVAPAQLTEKSAGGPPWQEWLVGLGVIAVLAAGALWVMSRRGTR